MRWMLPLLVVSMLAGCGQGDDTPKYVAKPTEVPDGWVLADINNETLAPYFEAAGMKRNPGYADAGLAAAYVNIERSYAALYVGPDGEMLLSAAAKFEDGKDIERGVEYFGEYCDEGAAFRKGDFVGLVGAIGDDVLTEAAWDVASQIMDRTGAEDLCAGAPASST